MNTIEKASKLNSIFTQGVIRKFNLDDYASHVTFKKHKILSPELISPDNFPIILKGILAVYLQSETGEANIIDFKRNGQLIRPGIHVDYKKTGQLYAKCITDVEIVLTKRAYICSLINESKSLSKTYFSLLEEELSSVYNQLKLLKDANLEKRYETFLKDYKDVYNFISDRMIANYLGVHYTTLARIKKKLI